MQRTTHGEQATLSRNFLVCTSLSVKPFFPFSHHSLPSPALILFSTSPTSISRSLSLSLTLCVFGKIIVGNCSLAGLPFRSWAGAPFLLEEGQIRRTEEVVPSAGAARVAEMPSPFVEEGVASGSFAVAAAVVAVAFVVVVVAAAVVEVGRMEVHSFVAVGVAVAFASVHWGGGCCCCCRTWGGGAWELGGGMLFPCGGMAVEGGALLLLGAAMAEGWPSPLPPLRPALLTSVM